MNSNQKILSLLPLLHKVVAVGSFQQAANQLNLPRSSVSKKIMQLEELLGQPVLNRTTRQLHLTEVGKELIRVSHALPELLGEINSLVDSHLSSPTGVVRISCATLLGQQVLLPEIQELRALYPNVVIELNLEDRYSDLIAQQIDIAIRTGHLPDSQQIAKKIGNKTRCFAATPDYLKQLGTPFHPSELSTHHCIVYKNQDGTYNHWPYQEHRSGSVKSVEVGTSLCTDDVRTLVDLALLGNGVIYADKALLRPWLECGKLVEVLEAFVPDEQEPIQLLRLGRSGSRAAKVIWEELAIRLPPKL